MRFNWRHRFRIGPLFVYATKRGFTSWGWKLGPLTLNRTRGTWTLDTPGPGSLSGGGKRRRRRPK